MKVFWFSEIAWKLGSMIFWKLSVCVHLFGSWFIRKSAWLLMLDFLYPQDRELYLKLCIRGEKLFYVLMSTTNVPELPLLQFWTTTKAPVSTMCQQPAFSFPPHCPVTREEQQRTLHWKAGYWESWNCLVTMNVETSQSHLHSLALRWTSLNLPSDRLIYM